VKRLWVRILPLLNRVKQVLQRHRKVIGYALAVLIGGVLLYGLIRNWKHADWSSLQLDVSYLLLPLIPHAFGLALGALGWALIVKSLESGLSLWHSSWIYFLSNAGRNLPGGFWHIAGRIYLHKRTGAPEASTAVATGIELILAALTGTAVYVVLVLLGPGVPLLPRGWLIAILLAEASLLIPPIFNKLVNWSTRRSTNQSETPIVIKGTTILGWIFLYSVILFIGGLVLFLVAKAVYPLEWQELPFVIGAWGISMAVGSLTFWIPFRLGIRDGVLVMMLSILVPMSVALVIAALFRMWVSASELVWSAVAAGIGRLKSK
jgi:hypothetical protein